MRRDEQNRDRLDESERRMILAAAERVGPDVVADTLRVARATIGWAACGYPMRRSTLTCIRARLPELAREVA